MTEVAIVILKAVVVVVAEPTVETVGAIVMVVTVVIEMATLTREQDC
jgi:hypothetical protein